MGGAEVHHSHRDVTGGWLRPAVFGVSDGLVSNLGLIVGVAGGASAAGATGTTAVVIAGLAGLAAGAFSMAAGEYVSVASQAELARAEIDLERRELARRPEAEMAELADLWVSRGLDREFAEEFARQLTRDPEKALEVHAREELGLTLDDLPNPWVAAGSSFVAFALGALLPVLPYLVGVTSVLPSLVLSLLGLFGAGALVARVTARPWWYSGLRLLVVGALAAGVTWVVGTLVGTGLS
ncbi:MAG: VIT1/CCC1 transporter family protein [Candidatus Nanopelagicales bacterium]